MSEMATIESKLSEAEAKLSQAEAKLSHVETQCRETAAKHEDHMATIRVQHENQMAEAALRVTGLQDELSATKEVEEMLAARTEEAQSVIATLRSELEKAYPHIRQLIHITMWVKNQICFINT